ncbi:cellulase-like family protein [Vallitalea guaymasensis]|uniref:cellulase-like family protein n=1 Tax=Vallitalea guaymasensis TaxID=1185412 RepID=UPI00272B9366|nr:cellulase-like family protein [Vallitalea guaymasensis]
MKKTVLRELKHPVAIAMWDFSWLIRSHKGGGFEDWDKALDELVERGYNAIRIEVFPHLVACDDREEFLFPFVEGKNGIWENQQDFVANPKKALLEFLPKCHERGIYIALSSWMYQPELPPKTIGLQGFITIWEKTLDFLQKNELLGNILYVDLLNEYPLWNGFTELKKEALDCDRVSTDIVNTHMQKEGVSDFGERGKIFLKQFSRKAVNYFQNKWSQLDFGFCITANADDFKPELSADYSAFDFLDLHIWFVHNKAMNHFQDKIDNLNTEAKEKEFMLDINKYWTENKEKMKKWMEENFKKFYQLSKQYKVPLGNTEGWGLISWPQYTHDWDFIKEAAEICVDLSLKYNYKFICTSNFTHPHFLELWADIDWHKQITNKIKSKKLIY